MVIRRARPFSRLRCRSITVSANASAIRNNSLRPTLFSKRERVGCEAKSSPSTGSRPTNSLCTGAQLMNEVIKAEYETKKQKTRYACWILLQRACERTGALTPTYMTFCTAVRKRAGFDQNSKRKGHRAAYSQEPFYFELALKTPRHGDRPFEICHIDHTELDIELVCSRTRQNVGRPWYTILTDAFSRRLLAIFLTFDPPSYRSCMMVLRECVRRHGRL